MLRPEVAMARKLRRAMSLPEVLLWQRLRGSALGGRFRKGHPIGPYVADFYCAAARLVVEVDGEIHAQPAAQDHDRARDRFMRDNGYHVIRVTAVEVLRDADGVAAAIAALVAAPLHHPADGPPPRAGEDWGVLRRCVSPPRNGEGDRPAQPGGGGGVPRILRADVAPDLGRHAITHAHGRGHPGPDPAAFVAGEE